MQTPFQLTAGMPGGTLKSDSGAQASLKQTLVLSNISIIINQLRRRLVVSFMVHHQPVTIAFECRSILSQYSKPMECHSGHVTSVSLHRGISEGGGKPKDAESIEG